jgi:acetylornithine deacetylase/succinyl-diaminopimelate desuccinylase family protein
VSPFAGTVTDAVDARRVSSRLGELVATNSENPPGNEAAAAEVVSGFCEEIGLEVSQHEATAHRPSVVARARFGDGPTIGYCSHIDTVPVGDPGMWEHDPFGARISDGVLWGRGACDAKGPVVAALEAVTVLRELDAPLAGTVELELVSDEETMGFLGTAHLVRNEIVSPDAVIVGEPTSLRLVRAQRGACWMRVKTRGLAAHGSAPERGRNAILHMAEILTHLNDVLPDISHPVLGGPSINVGTITGGEKVNMVAGSCVVEIDRRTLPGETSEGVVNEIRSAVERARARHTDLDASVELAFYGAPFEVDEGSALVRDVAAALTEARGEPPELMGFRGASDARYFAEAGIPVVVCGPGDIVLAHTVREHVELAEVETAAVAYALAFARLLGRGT